jgi:hypothetical protein
VLWTAVVYRGCECHHRAGCCNGLITRARA